MILGRKRPKSCISRFMRDHISELIGRINETKERIAETVTAGTGVATFEIYQRLVGRAEGMQIILDLIDDLLTEDQNSSE